jgi:small multidrug resistance pump
VQPLAPWMRYLLWFAGCYNLLVGLNLVVFYHEAFKTLKLFGEKPELMLFVQLVGVLVGLFGVGYIIVARNPVENRNVLLLGLLSKGLGSVLGIGYVALGKLPPEFLVLLFFSDIIYLPPFAVILRRLYRAAAAGAR